YVASLVAGFDSHEKLRGNGRVDRPHVAAAVLDSAGDRLPGTGGIFGIGQRDRPLGGKIVGVLPFNENLVGSSASPPLERQQLDFRSRLINDHLEGRGIAVLRGVDRLAARGTDSEREPVSSVAWHLDAKGTLP